MKQFLIIAALLLGCRAELFAQCTATVGFTAQPSPGNPIMIAFAAWILPLDVSSDDCSLLWDFGDGTTATDPTPTHTYYCAGFYTVCLNVVFADGCTATTCDTLTIGTLIGASCSADFAITPFEAGASNYFAFIDQSVADEPILTYWWDFGDNTSANDPYPTHYFEDGTYHICLTIMAGIPGTTSFCIDQHCSDFTVATSPIVIATAISELIVEPFSLTATPNPMSNEGSLQLNCPIAYPNLTLIVYNAAGIPLWSQTADYSAGVQFIDLPAYRWRRGFYTAVALHDGAVLGSAKFV